GGLPSRSARTSSPPDVAVVRPCGLGRSSGAPAGRCTAGGGWGSYCPNSTAAQDGATPRTAGGGGKTVWAGAGGRGGEDGGRRAGRRRPTPGARRVGRSTRPSRARRRRGVASAWRRTIRPSAPLESQYARANTMPRADSLLLHLRKHFQALHDVCETAVERHG